MGDKPPATSADTAAPPAAKEKALPNKRERQKLEKLKAKSGKDKTPKHKPPKGKAVTAAAVEEDIDSQDAVRSRTGADSSKQDKWDTAELNKDPEDIAMEDIKRYMDLTRETQLAPRGGSVQELLHGADGWRGLGIIAQGNEYRRVRRPVRKPDEQSRKEARELAEHLCETAGRVAVQARVERMAKLKFDQQNPDEFAVVDPPDILEDFRESIARAIPPEKTALGKKMINIMMRSGKKETAEKVMEHTLRLVREGNPKEYPMLLHRSFCNVAPLLEVRKIKKGAASFNVPVPVYHHRRAFLAARWLIDAARERKGERMHKSLAQQFLDAAENRGDAVRKRVTVHKLAKAGRAFAHFRWF